MPVGESRYMEPLQLAGRLIMENGGETYRVEETITRMGKAFGLERVESFAVPSGLFISYCRQDGDNETSVTRVRKGSRHLSRVDAVNAVSRQVEKGELSCEEALARLREIAGKPSHVSRPMLILAAAASAAGFAGMFGGSVVDMLISGSVAALVEVLTHVLERLNLRDVVSTLLGSLFSALLPMLFHRLTGMGAVELIVAGALMPLLPGLAMTNAVQDALRGDMVSGLSHGLSAVLTAVLVAGGALVASAVMSLMGGAPV
ncbi:MAG: threonine/serine exporter family protein [Clostridiales bacterium]|nr:threonine/serine exporter family protein [Clostridiales bacterium]